jgi:hypothetical protein
MSSSTTNINQIEVQAKLIHFNNTLECLVLKRYPTAGNLIANSWNEFSREQRIVIMDKIQEEIRKLVDKINAMQNMDPTEPNLKFTRYQEDILLRQVVKILIYLYHDPDLTYLKCLLKQLMFIDLHSSLFQMEY